jgi:hypothetical protein
LFAFILIDATTALVKEVSGMMLVMFMQQLVLGIVGQGPRLQCRGRMSVIVLGRLIM